MTDVVLSEVRDRIATITLNRPEARNALSRAVIKGLRAAVRAAQADDGVDVLILTGADPAFCAGLDLKELGSDTGSGSVADTQPTAETPVAERGPLPPGPKPVIGAINGAAITGGFELALACDFLVASDRARFADTHARVGIQPWWGLSVLLPQAIGLRRAREMSATGNFCDAQKALEWGLVNHVVPHDDLLPHARRLAGDIVSNDQEGVQQILDTYRRCSATTPEAAWEIERRAATDWARTHLDADEVARRRQAIVDRGRSQL